MRTSALLLLAAACALRGQAAPSPLDGSGVTDSGDEGGGAPAPPPPPPSLFWGFDAGFGDNMVLQRAPAAAAVYGYLDTPAATGVRVTVSRNGQELYSVDAAINATAQPFGPGWGVRPCPKAVCPPYDMDTFTPFPYPLPTWKALLQPTPAGENYTVTAICTGCNASAPVEIASVAFGDVWYCSGQSNMLLPMRYTFTRNDTAAAIAAGYYSSIRVMAGSSGNAPYASWPPAYGNSRVRGASNPWMTASQAAPAGCVDSQSCPLFEIGATCWYTAQAMVDEDAGGALAGVPIGLINTALGGQRIEEYMVNTTTAACSGLNSQDIPWWNGQLYGTFVIMFTDMTVKGWLWYQGENNMGGMKGNSLAGTGYACAMEQLVRGWRAAWSATPGTTDPLAPFGVVTLASSGSEGGPDLGTMRLAQTASYGVTPSLGLPNTFLAQAYDLDDEWGPTAGPCFAQWGCCAGKTYNSTVCAGREPLCAPACAAQADTPILMGGIHPRSKKPVGQRLGRAALAAVYGAAGAATGPTLAGCEVSGESLVVSFNATLLRGDVLHLQPTFPAVGSGGGSQLWVQTNASLFCMEPLCVLNATTGRCATIDPDAPRSPTATYCPTWAGGDGATVLPAGVFDSGWVQLNFTAGPTGTEIVVDLTPLAGAAPTAVRYAWGIIDCCNHTDPDLYVSHGCIAGCPIMGAPSGLPANPFQARIVGGSCECVAPQECSGSGGGRSAGRS